MVWVLATCCIALILCYDMTYPASPSYIASHFPMPHKMPYSLWPFYSLCFFFRSSRTHQQNLCVKDVEHNVGRIVEIVFKFCCAQSAFPPDLPSPPSNFSVPRTRVVRMYSQGAAAFSSDPVAVLLSSSTIYHDVLELALLVDASVRAGNF